MSRISKNVNIPYTELNYYRYALCKKIAITNILLQNTKYLHNIDTIYDVMAGVGISGKIFLKYFPNSTIFLNDISKECVNVLCSIPQFINKQIQITNQDCFSLELPKVVDLIFIDYNSFTCNECSKVAKERIYQLKQWLVKNKSKLNWVLISDTYVFSLKFQKDKTNNSQKFSDYKLKFEKVLTLKIIAVSCYKNNDCCLFLCKINEFV